MAEIPFNDLVGMFYNEHIKVKYPKTNIPKEEIDRICRTPFLFVRKNMKRDDFPTIRLLHLGRFTVLENKVRKLTSDNETDYLAGHISPETYERRKAGFEAILSRFLHPERERLQIIDDTEDTPSYIPAELANLPDATPSTNTQTWED